MGVTPPPSSDQAKPVLGYATRVGEYPQPEPHGKAAVWLIGLTALSGFASIILGLFCLVGLVPYAVLLVCSGIAICWATLGKLSANTLNFKAGLLLLVVALAVEIFTIFLADHDLVEQLAQIQRERLFQNDTDWVSMYEAVRNLSVVPAAMTALTACYAAGRLFRRA